MRHFPKVLLKSPLGIAHLALVVAAAVACSGKSGGEQQDQPADAVAEQHLAVFDTLDFDVFSNQKWDRLGESHAADIVVTWPDGHETTGIDTHINDLKAMFVYAPDTKIKEHPVRIASGEWTAVTGVMTGTFSQPMPITGGKTIPPTGKSFKLNMATVAQWKDGKMAHEWLFWDNQTFMKQIGLAP